MVRVFTYQTAPAGSPEEIAEEAFGICNGHPPRRPQRRPVKHCRVEIEKVAVALGPPAGCEVITQAVHCPLLGGGQGELDNVAGGPADLPQTGAELLA